MAQSAYVASVRAGLAVLALAALSMTLSGCSSTNNAAKKALNPDPPGQIYARADDLMERGKFEAAAQRFEDVDREHPYAPEARRALVMAAYSYFRAGKYIEAVSTARRYTTLHPGTKEAALAHHIIAMSYYNEIKGPNRDQTPTRKALKEFKTLVARYPQSKYAKEAANRIRYCQDLLAASEMTVGRYYLKKRNFLAAINRFKTVARDFQTTKHVEEALMRLTEAYMALGIRSEAQNAAAVLGHNFPHSKWYRDAYALLASDGLAPRADTGSWLSQAWKQTVRGVTSLGAGASFQ